jgi:hypothetical protein
LGRENYGISVGVLASGLTAEGRPNKPRPPPLHTQEKVKKGCPIMDHKSRIQLRIQRFEEKREKDRKAGEDPPPERKKGKPRSKNPDEWTEAQIQRAVANVLDRLNVCWCHVPNEGKRNKIAGNMLRAAGLKSGCPDILVFSRAPNKPNARGVAIELKRARGGRLSENQKVFLQSLEKCGWYTEVCHGYDAAIMSLEDLGFLKKKGN